MPVRVGLAVLSAGALLGMCSVVTANAQGPSPLHRLVDIAAQRLMTADPVAAYKWVNGGLIEDRDRAAQVLDMVGVDARSRGLDEKFVRGAFENQIHATEGVEYARFSQWKFDPAHAPGVAPDLAETRASIDGLNHAMVTEMASRRDVLVDRECAAALAAARDSVVAARGLDPLYRSALEVATSSYCGQR
jgi:chorismate mutase